ncbi:hypothetical protein V6N11_045172 [Hibiscus sabdariffa]|uniref:Alcohol dehydrogenase n=1 Tax=Hibiscus sabdariffa TaxID=183260 RepID=A0ABR1ZGD1_9ROSI
MVGPAPFVDMDKKAKGLGAVWNTTKVEPGAIVAIFGLGTVGLTQPRWRNLLSISFRSSSRECPIYFPTQNNRIELLVLTVLDWRLRSVT